ncbi:MAG: 50S ribosomal protein L15 [Elusimicrobiota bacterium]
MTINLSNLKPARGAKHRRKIVGRGEGSGYGQTCTRGMKGQGSRSGDGRMMGFEGGQTPLLRRVPKRGFNGSVFSRRYATVSLEALERHFQAGDTVTLEELRRRRLVHGDGFVKILATGKLTKKLLISVHAASHTASEAIVKAGGALDIISTEPRRAVAASGQKTVR